MSSVLCIASMSALHRGNDLQELLRVAEPTAGSCIIRLLHSTVESRSHTKHNLPPSGGYGVMLERRKDNGKASVQEAVDIVLSMER